MRDDDPNQNEKVDERSGVSRRDFLKISSISVAVPLVTGPKVVFAAVEQAFVDNDASQCGFCTPGFVVACKAFLDKHPNPTPEDIRRGLSGNLCRCGTYHGIQLAIAQLAQKGA